MNLARRALLSSVTLVGLLAPTHAGAFRTARDLPSIDSDGPVTWATSSVDYYVSATNYPGASFAAVNEAIQAGLILWQTPECGFDGFVYRGVDGGPESGDGRNTIAWYQSNWSEAGYPPDAMAVTDVLYAEVSPGVWEVVEADVLLNGYDFLWRSGTADVADGQRSIDAVIAHEAGHMLGILHPCELDGSNGAVTCGGSDQHVGTLMHPLYAPSSRGALTSDDVAALCHQFPEIPCEPACDAGLMCTFGECVTQPEPPELCVTDAECPSHGICLEGTCADYSGQLGDPCDSDEWCNSGLCRNGRCTEACDTTECPGNYECNAAAGSEATCEPTLGEFADQCMVGEDCVSGMCLSGRSSKPLCTRPCPAPSDAACPHGFECVEVDQLSVCAPEPRASGCSAHPATGRRGSWVWLLLCLVTFFRAQRPTRVH